MEAPVTAIDAKKERASDELQPGSQIFNRFGAERMSKITVAGTYI
jgi:hypothetical protein